MIHVEFSGVTSYREMWDRQKSLFSEAVRKKKNKEPVDDEYVIITQHLPVITLGFHANEKNLLQSDFWLHSHGIEAIRIERGGDVTYHGPGQLVAYPIIDLENYHIGVREYVYLIEETVIDLLSDYGIKGERIEGASGVWIGKGTSRERKICALGIKCSHYITMHGLALNVNTDLKGFSLINPCGFVDKGVTSMAEELGHTLDFDKVGQEFADIFIRKICDKRKV